MPADENQPEAEPQIPAEADLGQSGEGVPSPEASVDAYVESLGMKYDDELNLGVVSDEMLPQVAARLAQTNPEAARRMALRHSDYTTKRQRDAEEARTVQDEKARLEQYAAAMPQNQQPQQPPTDYGAEYADPAVVQLRQEQEQLKRNIQDMYTQMNVQAIQQGLDEVQRRHPDMTAPGAREGLLQFQHKSGIRDSEQAYWAMKGPDAVAKALAAEKPTAPAAPQVPPSGSGPAKSEPPKTPEAARAGIVGFLKKRGVGKLEDL